jgi:uncharacterized membrane protein
VIIDGDDPLEVIKQISQHVLEYAIVAKVLDDDGSVALLTAKTGTLTSWEALGMLETAIETVKHQMMSELWTTANSDDDESDEA